MNKEKFDKENPAKQIIFLADWVRNTIDKCEVLARHGADGWEIKRPRPQPTNMFFVKKDRFAQHKICDSYNEAMEWIKTRRLQQVNDYKAKAELSEKRLADVVKYYE